MAALVLVGCGDELVCGAGTVRSGTTCVTATPVATCSDGGVIVGGNCYPDPQLLCGPNTVWDPALRACRGMGDGNCADTCSPAGSQTVCVSGHVYRFVDPTTPATSASGLKVRAYDPIAFATNPQSAMVLGESSVRDDGCYAIDGIARPSSGLIAISVTDAQSPMGDIYTVAGSGSPLAAGRNVTDLSVYYIERTTVDAWQSQVADPTLLADGMWMGWYLDPAGHPVAGVTPSRPGDDPAPSTIYCFRGDRMTLTTEDTTDATGLCVLSPDPTIEGHSGRCGAAACIPPFPSPLGGTAPNVIFLQILQQM